MPVAIRTERRGYPNAWDPVEEMAWFDITPWYLKLPIDTELTFGGIFDYEDGVMGVYFHHPLLFYAKIAKCNKLKFPVHCGWKDYGIGVWHF